MQRSLFIVIYGVNNLGKTTQAKLLVERLNKEWHRTEYLKYPKYDIEPSGPMINDYLRGGNPLQLSFREFQILNVLNRTQFEPILKAQLESGIHIVSEDYVGSGLGWGIGAGVDGNFLKKLNSHLLKEDIVFLFDGQRFGEAKEATHQYEQNDDLTERARAAHRELAEEFNWKIIDANDSVERIHALLWDHLKLLL